MIRWHQRLNSFSQALDKLEEALNQTDWKELEKDGVIQRFEFTFELAWKTLQDYFEKQGYKDVKGPSKVVQQAFADGFLSNEENWVKLLSDRNLMTHTYDREASDKVFENIKECYFQLLCDLFHKLEQEKNK